ncbi:penicillin-binding protein [Schaalia sp. 19OD2882]|uniref:transglycosylase domain-containing protein n=1 Tax=Schaalia sp. 19OD2882 TaxID=2794089 RepID=UPI001C1F1057|nr:transglycosylase domain-containing protein [Schaalia sp. 19OD2882]QWW19711.1 penicillin-binding protein [Schaalia sp. 19OD2882]
MAQRKPRLMNPAQLLALFIAFFSVSGLIGVLGAGLMVPVTGSAAAATRALPTIFEDLPGELQIVSPAEESTMLDAEGRVIARFYDKQRIVVPSDKINDTMKKAIVAIEDKRFYEHKGIDPTGMGRAFVNNLAGSSTQGASTITQQFVRNAMQERGYLEGDADLVEYATEQTPQRKLREAKYALALEQRMDKDAILTGYLNIAPFGPTIYGVEAAARTYFSKAAAELTYPESALLAGLVQSPVEYNPLEYPEAAQERRNIVLGVMKQEKLITPEEHDQMVAIPVADMLKPRLVKEGCSGANSIYAYFCSFAIEQFMNDKAFGETTADREHLLKTGGLTIRTTIDPKKQTAAYESLVNAIPDNDTSGLDTTMVSVVPQTGQIVAMAQNTTFGLGEGQTMANFAADGHFQVGSTFKVFTLVEWFKEGHGAYETVGRNNTVYGNGSFTCDGGPIYTDTYDVNDLAGKQGTYNVIQATGMSINQAYVNMASRIDFCKIFTTAADFGVTAEDGQPIAAYPANVLGSASSSPLHMASAFATFVNDGKLCAPQSIRTVSDRDENTLKEYQPSCNQIIASDVAAKTATLLNRAVNSYYTQTVLEGGRPYGAKSGTTDYNSNTWLTGFTPQLSTSAWVGHANASTTPVNDVVINGTWYDAIYGESFVGRNIWAPYMSRALAGTDFVPIPDAYIGSPPANNNRTNQNNNNRQTR